MKRLLVVMSLVPALAAAADKPAAPTPQTSRMATCTSQAGEQKLSGDARKQFMAECLKAPADASPARTDSTGTRGEAMKRCNKDASAKGLKGDERKAFMSQCLRAGPKS
jgi:hypothetical protein